MGSDGGDSLTLESIRNTLIRMEDSIVFSLIERSKFSLNSPAYDKVFLPSLHGSLLEFLVRGTEAVQSQGGRYQTPEEVPFFLKDLPPPLVHPNNCTLDLPPAAASVNVNKKILDAYINQFLPLVAPKGDDGNYALAVAADLACLQALSRRIHYGKYVAEAKFRNDRQGYSAAIRANDTKTITNQLTNSKVEAMVKQRVEKKGMVFGQDVTLSNTNNNTRFKVDPSMVFRLYDDLVIPVTKDVELEYLMRGLD